MNEKRSQHSSHAERRAYYHRVLRAVMQGKRVADVAKAEGVGVARIRRMLRNALIQTRWPQFELPGLPHPGRACVRLTDPQCLQAFANYFETVIHHYADSFPDVRSGVRKHTKREDAA